MSCSSVVLPEPDDADDRDAIAFRDRELDAAQHLDVAADVAERLDEPARLEQRGSRATHSASASAGGWRAALNAG